MVAVHMGTQELDIQSTFLVPPLAFRNIKARMVGVGSPVQSYDHRFHARQSSPEEGTISPARHR